MTALFLACSYGNYEVMKLLVKEFADVNAKANVSKKPSVYTTLASTDHMCNMHL